MAGRRIDSAVRPHSYYSPPMSSHYPPKTCLSPSPYRLIIILGLVLTGCLASQAKSPVNRGGEAYRFLNIDVDSLIMAAIGTEGKNDISGIWTATTDGASVGILSETAWRHASGMGLPDDTRNLAEKWVMILIDSPDPTLQPGTLMGWFYPAAKPDHYVAKIYTKSRHNKLVSPAEFTLRLADDGHLIMTAVKRGIIINPWRLLPYMIRGLIRYRDDSPRDLNGFIKRWPRPRNPQNPIYL